MSHINKACYKNGRLRKYTLTPQNNTPGNHAPPRDKHANLRSKEARAEQNRKAQAMFRRRREEKMKQLEADSAALGPTRQRLAVAEARLLEMALVSESLRGCGGCELAW